MRNIYQQFKALIPDPPLQVGTIAQVVNDIAVVQLPDGGRLTARGSDLVVGQVVFTRNGVIEGTAPALPVETIEI